jgi:hypothetical protein
MNTYDSNFIKYKFKICKGSKTFRYKKNIELLNKPIKSDYKLESDYNSDKGYDPDYENVKYEYFKDLMCEWMNSRGSRRYR